MGKAMTIRSELWRFGAWRVLLALLLALLIGCEITLISKYDPMIDTSATALQKEMDTFLTGLETTAGMPEADYTQHEQFYSDYLVELRSVLVRAESHPKNEITAKQLRLMIDSLEQLRVVHQAGPIDTSPVSTMRDLFNQGWRAVITLELAKKRGDD